ncbi:unnamed protein product [Schistocephalus solidus]|uniref:PHD domain-containing protein n=1 Tax=Schistocephalus solidus TaxID=70667 RepID=A0A183SJE0_SCHSO|nr:unnamed protein product [Schistocephalus solidus]
MKHFFLFSGAPSDYLPKGFKTDDSPDFVFAAGPVNIKMGLIETDCGVMILCDGCESWQHAVCFRIIDEADVPKSHLCRDCAKTKVSEHLFFTLDCTTFAFYSVCLFRRALFLCANNDMLSVCSISKQLGVNANVAKGLMNKLQNEGAVKDVRGRRYCDFIL